MNALRVRPGSQDFRPGSLGALDRALDRGTTVAWRELSLNDPDLQLILRLKLEGLLMI